MPAPTATLPPTRAGNVGRPRTRLPAATSPTAPARARSWPNRAPIAAPANEPAAMASTAPVCARPAALAEVPSSARAVSSSGGYPARAARRLAASASTPSSSTTGRTGAAAVGRAFGILSPPDVKWFKFIFNPYGRRGRRAVQVLLDDYGRAAAVATDLVNTAPEVAVSTGDGLADPAALAAFLARHELVLDALAGRPPVEGDVAAVHRLRRELRALVDTADPAALASGLGRLLGAAADRPRPGRRRRGRLALAGAVPPAAPGSARSSPCCSRPGCSACCGCSARTGSGSAPRRPAPGAFVDTSRGGRRRYCVPEICGNRINVANHRARRRATQR